MSIKKSLLHLVLSKFTTQPRTFDVTQLFVTNFIILIKCTLRGLSVAFLQRKTKKLVRAITEATTVCFKHQKMTRSVNEDATAMLTFLIAFVLVKSSDLCVNYKLSNLKFIWKVSGSLESPTTHSTLYSKVFHKIFVTKLLYIFGLFYLIPRSNKKNRQFSCRVLTAMSTFWIRGSKGTFDFHFRIKLNFEFFLFFIFIIKSKNEFQISSSISNKNRKMNFCSFFTRFFLCPGTPLINHIT